MAFPDKIKDSHTFSSTVRSRVAGEELWRLPAPCLELCSESGAARAQQLRPSPSEELQMQLVRATRD